MSAVSATDTKPRRGFPGLATLQRIGRSLMLPIASLPAAALLMRLGQPDMLGSDGVASWNGFAWMQPVSDVVGAAGNALFDWLPLLFAVGVAVGFARKSDGTTGLAAVVGYMVFRGVTTTLAPTVLGSPESVEGGIAACPTGTGAGSFSVNAADQLTVVCGTQPVINYGVLGGIIIGIVTALLYQRFYRIKLPAYLAFFGGRRFVPIITAVAAMLIAVVMSLIYPWFNSGFTAVGDWVTTSGPLGAFIFGFTNRMLLPFGLHHLLNSFPWFQFGEFADASGAIWHGDIARFLHGDPTAGMFMTGFFPILMFALPAAALAIWHSAKGPRRKVIGGIMISAALTAFITGVTEPIEFSFVYVAFPLYVVHALLTGSAMALTSALGIRDGFGFSAGAIDFTLNLGIAEKPLLLAGIGLAYAAVYYFLFRWVIKRWDLKTPGREDDDGDSMLEDALPDPVLAGAKSTTDKAASGPKAGKAAPNGTVPESTS